MDDKEQLNEGLSRIRKLAGLNRSTQLNEEDMTGGDRGFHRANIAKDKLNTLAERIETNILRIDRDLKEYDNILAGDILNSLDSEEQESFNITRTNLGDQIDILQKHWGNQ